jgi:hypothetical protein
MNTVPCLEDSRFCLGTLNEAVVTEDLIALVNVKQYTDIHQYKVVYVQKNKFNARIDSYIPQRLCAAQQQNCSVPSALGNALRFKYRNDCGGKRRK